MGGKKPTSPHKRHGLDALIDEKDLGENQFVSNMIKDAGKTFKPAGNVYTGSFVVHMYQSSSENVIKELNFATQVVYEVPFSEQVAQSALQTLTLQVMRFFGHKKTATRDKSDKRGRFPTETFREGNE